MTPHARKIVSWSVLVLAIALGGLALFARRTKTVIGRQLAAAQAEGERLRAEARMREARTAAAAKTPAAKVEVAPSASQPTFPARIRAPGLVDLAREHPQLWNEFIASKRVEMGRFYFPVMERLQLTPEQRERLKDILSAELARGSDIHAAGTEQGLAHEDPALVKLRAESVAQRRREINDLVGPAGLKEFEDFERATPMRGAVNGFAVQVARIAPLSSLQADQLERALAQSNAEFRQGNHAVATALDWDQADRLAQSILSPQQFEIWKLGVAHNSFGGPRIEQELHRIYEQAMARAQVEQARAQR